MPVSATPLILSTDSQTHLFSINIIMIKSSRPAEMNANINRCWLHPDDVILGIGYSMLLGLVT